jgi:hypothetical protein
MSRSGMIAVGVRDHRKFDGPPWVDIKVSSLTVEAMFSESDHV